MTYIKCLDTGDVHFFRDIPRTTADVHGVGISNLGVSGHRNRWGPQDQPVLVLVWRRKLTPKVSDTYDSYHYVLDFWLTRFGKVHFHGVTQDVTSCELYSNVLHHDPSLPAPSSYYGFDGNVYLEHTKFWKGQIEVHGKRPTNGHVFVVWKHFHIWRNLWEKTWFNRHQFV